MKIRIGLDEHYRDVFTLSELEQAKALRAQYARDYDPSWIRDCAETGARMIARQHGEFFEELYKVTACVTGNGRLEYDLETGRMDIWIDTAFRSSGSMYTAGFYISDIYQVTGDDDDGTLLPHMYIRRYKEA